MIVNVKETACWMSRNLQSGYAMSLLVVLLKEGSFISTSEARES